MLKIFFALFLLGLVYRNSDFLGTLLSWLGGGAKFSNLSDTPELALTEMTVFLVWLVASVFTVSKLLGQFEQGAIFTARSTRLLRRLGWLALVLVYWNYACRC